MSAEEFFEKESSQVGIFLMGISRSIWNVIISLVIILTFVYGMLLKSVGSRFIAVLLCAGLFGLLIFMSLYDAKKSRDNYVEFKNSKRGGAKRL